ncbi:hypothetical protein [Aeromonas hydrophila]
MKKILCFLGVLMGSSANAEVFSGTIAYSLDGISGVIPFSIEEGKEESLTHEFSKIPYTSKIVNNKKETASFRQGGDFTIQLNNQDGNRVMAAYTFKLAKFERMKTFKVKNESLEFPESRHVENGGYDILTRGVGHTVYEYDNAIISILIN